MEGIRDRLYGFVMYSPKHTDGDRMGQPKTDMALDISFGSSGYALVLARAFKKVYILRMCPAALYTHKCKFIKMKRAIGMEIGKGCFAYP